MPDNKNNRGGADRKRINVNEDYELRYWTKTLGVSADELRKAVQSKGDSVETIRAFFDKK